MRLPRLRSSPSFFHASTNRRMYKLDSSGEMGEPCGIPRPLSLPSVVRVFRPRRSVSSTGHSSHILIRCYLDKQYPDKPLFGCSMARAQALLIKYWVEKTLQPLASRMLIYDIWCKLHDKDREYFRETREKRFGKPLEEIPA